MHSYYALSSLVVFSYRRYFIGSFLVLTWLALFTYSIYITPSGRGEKTLWIVDTSLSMSVEDIVESGSITHSRLDLAKAIIKNSIREAPWENAVITYARSAWVASPFTPDRGFLIDVTESLRVTDIYGGSDISSAFALVHSLYATLAGPLHIILISDWGSTTDLTHMSDLPSGADLTIIGIGTPKWGKIPLGYNLEGERRYKYFEGKEIVVPYEKSSLETLANEYHSSIIEKSEWDTTLSLWPWVFASVDPGLYRIIGLLMLLLGYLYHPYAQQRK